MVEGISGLHANREAGRALQIALSGGHHLLLTGPAGSGKTGLIRALPGLLPPLMDIEAREVEDIYARAGEHRSRPELPPIRIPTPASTPRGVLGFGTRPGEIELSHRGVLALRHLTGFRRDTLGALLESSEEGILRPPRRPERPAAVMVIATMASCACGGTAEGCVCTQAHRARHRRRAAEPLGAIFDIQCEMQPPTSQGATGLAAMRIEIERAREIARERFGKPSTNARMTAEEVSRFCPLDRAGRAYEEAIFRGLPITPGIFGRLLRVARTIADLAGSEPIRPAHLAEALSCRSLLTAGPFLEGVDDERRPRTR